MVLLSSNKWFSNEFLKAVPCFGFCFWFVVPWLWVLPALGCDDVRPACEIQFLYTVCSQYEGFFNRLNLKQNKRMGDFLGKPRGAPPVGMFSFWIWALLRAERCVGWTGCRPCTCVGPPPFLWAAAASGAVWTACSTIGTLLWGMPWSPIVACIRQTQWRRSYYWLKKEKLKIIFLFLPKPSAALYCWLRREEAARWL